MDSFHRSNILAPSSLHHRSNPFAAPHVSGASFGVGREESSLENPRGGRPWDCLERWQLSTVKLGLFSDTGVGHWSQSLKLTHAAAGDLLLQHQIYMLARRVSSPRFLLRSRGLRF